MRKTSYFLLAVTILAASCTKNEEPVSEPARRTEQVSIRASIDNEYSSADGTRVTLDSSTGKASWQSGDEISIKVASDNTVGTDRLATEDCVTFCGTIASPSYATGDRIYAAYPATSLTVTASSISATVSIESNQNGSLPQPTMIATSDIATGSSVENITLNFKQSGALLILNTDTKMDEITLSAVGGEDVAGIYTYDFGSGSMTCSGSKSINVTPTSAVVYIHMPAISFSKGLCLTLTREGEKMIQSYSSISTLEAGKAYSLGTLTFKPVGISLGDVRTSYMNNGSVEKTNDIDGSQMLFGECSFTGISNAMVAEAGIEYDGTQAPATLSGKTFTPAALTGLEWKSYKVRAYVKTVDGNIFYSPEKDAAVTGIPYTAAPPTTSSWSTGNAADWQKCLRLNVSQAHALSPSFNIPTTLNITATALVYAYGGSIPSKYKPNVYISGSNTGTASGSATTLSGSSSLPITAAFTNVERNISLNSSVDKICIYAEGNKGSSLSVGTNGVVIKSVDVKYDL